MIEKDSNIRYISEYLKKKEIKKSLGNDTSDKVKSTLDKKMGNYAIITFTEPLTQEEYIDFIVSLSNSGCNDSIRMPGGEKVGYIDEKGLEAIEISIESLKILYEKSKQKSCRAYNILTRGSSITSANAPQQ